MAAIPLSISTICSKSNTPRPPTPENTNNSVAYMDEYKPTHLFPIN